MWIDEKFPKIIHGTYTVTSCASENYNCIAWAAGDNTAWWTYLPGYKWSNSSRDATVQSLVTMFTEMGYQVCAIAELEDGFDKVAIFGKDGNWTHASRQLPNGSWTSKLGVAEDIEHIALDDLSGDLYGEVHCIMRKARL